MAQYKYLRGTCDSRESVEFDISKHSQYITTCVVDADLLLCGIKTFPCNDGDDVKLTAQQQLDILELLLAERDKITSGIAVKTMESWYGSGLNFDEYCFPGDTVGEDVVDYFVNVVPPVTLRSDCVQSGEEHSCEPDDSGKYRATYTTFHRTGDGQFRFDGYCFKGENQNRVEKTYGRQRLEKCLTDARNEVELDAGLQMLTFDSLRYAKVDFIHRQCGNDYRIVRLKLPEVERVIGFDTPDGYDCDVWEETPDK